MLDIGDRFLITAPGHKSETLEVVTVYDDALVAIDVTEMKRGSPDQYRRMYFSNTVIDLYLKRGDITPINTQEDKNDRADKTD